MNFDREYKKDIKQTEKYLEKNKVGEIKGEDLKSSKIKDIKVKKEGEKFKRFLEIIQKKTVNNINICIKNINLSTLKKEFAFKKKTQNLLNKLVRIFQKKKN